MKPKSPFKLFLKGWMYSCLLILIAASIHVLIGGIAQYFKSGSTDLHAWFEPEYSSLIFSFIENLVTLIALVLVSAIGLFCLIFVVGSPVYALIFFMAYYFSKLLIKLKVQTFVQYFTVSYIFFGAPLAIFALYYSLSEIEVTDAELIHMTPFYAFVLVPFYIGYMWLNVVEKRA